MSNKILIFITKYLCYASNEIFAMQLSFSLKEQGYNVEICNIINNNYYDVELTKYIGKKYLAIIDFNSTLPRAMVGEDRFLDLLDGPFYNYIVDHPLYHHPILSIPLKNFNLICIDESHKLYVEKHYKHIKKILFLPLPGIKSSVNINFERKKNKILFTGTYYDINKYQTMIDKHPLRDKIYMLIDIMLNDRMLTVDEAYYKLENNLQINSYNFSKNTSIDDYNSCTVNNCKINYNVSNFAINLNSLYLADIYVRALDRKKLIDLFVSYNMDLIICGNEWEKYPSYNAPNIQWIKGMDYVKCVDLIASCQLLLNLMPGFKYGSHDRILTGMINNTAVISDSNNYINNVIGNENMITFDLESLSDSMYDLSEKISDKQYISYLAGKSSEFIKTKFNWKKIADKLIADFEKN